MKSKTRVEKPLLVESLVVFGHLQVNPSNIIVHISSLTLFVKGVFIAKEIKTDVFSDC